MGQKDVGDSSQAALPILMIYSQISTLKWIFLVGMIVKIRLAVTSKNWSSMESTRTERQNTPTSEDLSAIIERRMANGCSRSSHNMCKKANCTEKCPTKT